MPSCKSIRGNRQSRSCRQLHGSRKGYIIPKVTYGCKRERCFAAKNRQKATLPPKSDENGLFSEKEIAKIETVFKLFGESVATWLPVRDSFNGQMIKLSPVMWHFDLGFSPAPLHCRFEKNNLGTDFFEVELFK
jgi:hypothetical protein